MDKEQLEQAITVVTSLLAEAEGDDAIFWYDRQRELIGELLGY